MFSFNGSDSKAVGSLKERKYKNEKPTTKAKGTVLLW